MRCTHTLLAVWGTTQKIWTCRVLCYARISFFLMFTEESIVNINTCQCFSYPGGERCTVTAGFRNAAPLISTLHQKHEGTSQQEPRGNRDQRNYVYNKKNTLFTARIESENTSKHRHTYEVNRSSYCYREFPTWHVIKLTSARRVSCCAPDGFCGRTGFLCFKWIAQDSAPLFKDKCSVVCLWNGSAEIHSTPACLLVGMLGSYIKLSIFLLQMFCL